MTIVPDLNKARVKIHRVSQKFTSSVWFKGKSPDAGYSENNNEPSGSIKDGEFLDWLSVDYQLLKKNSAQWS
jgi:hypothetical protein